MKSVVKNIETLDNIDDNTGKHYNYQTIDFYYRNKDKHSRV